MSPSTPAQDLSNSTAKTPRQRWMAVLARASAEAIAADLPPADSLPAWRLLRGPDSGLIMLRARTGGAGAPFNLGEMTVTRCTLRLATGEVGHATVAGRDGRHAELAALADALLQDPAHHDCLLTGLIDKLAAGQDAARQAIAARASATRVQFFALQTMRT
ncbi:MAG: phosphonate C-P lyase system protein PhnG [Acetobacteraceae bacterium]